MIVRVMVAVARSQIHDGLDGHLDELVLERLGDERLLDVRLERVHQVEPRPRLVVHLEERKEHAHVVEILEVVLLLAAAIRHEQLHVRDLDAQEGVVVRRALLHDLDVLHLQLIGVAAVVIVSGVVVVSGSGNSG